MHTPPACPPPRLEARHLGRAFSGIPAIQDLSVAFAAAEIHGVVGENGAGKSTFMKVLAGLLSPDAGALWLDGHPVRLSSPHAALSLGIAMIHQEPSGFPDLSVAENLLVGNEPAARWSGWLNRPALHREAARLLARLRSNLRPQQRLGDLGVADRQIVEIARALARQARVLILDEPTSALSDAETRSLHEVMRDLRRDGVTLLFVSHRLEEVLALADRITVLRDGRLVVTCTPADLSPRNLVRHMAGHEVREHVPPAPPARTGPVVLEVSELGREPAFRDVSFAVRQGEILALAGLLGAGRTAVAQAVYGLRPARSGTIRLFGREVGVTHPRVALAHGVAMVPEDRRGSGLIPQASVQFNLTLSALRQASLGPFIRRAAEHRLVAEQIARFGIRTASPHLAVTRLSGGNQQKTLLARALLTRPRLLILDEPTRGIDVHAKTEIHALIRQLAHDGLGVLLISSELSEVLALAHRILVMRQGRLVGEMSPATAVPAAILDLAMPR